MQNRNKKSLVYYTTKKYLENKIIDFFRRFFYFVEFEQFMMFIFIQYLKNTKVSACLPVFFSESA